MQSSQKRRDCLYRDKRRQGVRNRGGRSVVSMVPETIKREDEM
jgi:hypothetical protein